MNPRIELAGQRYGDWRVIREGYPARQAKGTYYICQCAHCAGTKIIRGDNLRSGKATKHRGCPGPSYLAIVSPEAQEFVASGRTTQMAARLNAGAVEGIEEL